jgi:hypothetical protein
MHENIKCKSLKYGFQSFNVAHMPKKINTPALDQQEDY